LLLARRGARVVVNDLGQTAAGAVANDIVAAGGVAVAIAASVTDFTAVKTMVDDTVERWGTVDILVNNAGILRDKTFAKMDLADFRLVIEVHLMGAVNCTKAVWGHMLAHNYGRIVMTTSSSGLYGIRPVERSAAKMALVGLMQTLALEARAIISRELHRTNAATQMLEGLLPQVEVTFCAPVMSPGVLTWLARIPTRAILCWRRLFEGPVTLTPGIFVGDGLTPRDDPRLLAENRRPGWRVRSRNRRTAARARTGECRLQKSREGNKLTCATQ
jgi:NAD(P)-dependent dehydrogenase (short-subunit alcohol dehydrogenase family)